MAYSDLDLPRDLAIEIEALDQNIRAHDFYYVTEKQVNVLASMMNQGLGKVSRDVRIGVLRLLVGDHMKSLHGVEIQSTKNLSGPAASELISLLKDNDYDWELSLSGRRILALAKECVEATLVSD